MANRLLIDIKESASALKSIKKEQPIFKQVRIQMLLLMLEGKTETQAVIDALGVNKNSISLWKKRYNEGGIENLLSDDRGKAHQGQITEQMHQQIEKKLSSAEDGFLSYKEAQEWINKHFGLHMQYHAVNKYLKRKFKTKLKVARKSHINKDAASKEVFKNPG